MSFMFPPACPNHYTVVKQEYLHKNMVCLIAE